MFIIKYDSEKVIMKLRLKDFPVFKLLIVVAIIINIVQFQAIEERTHQPMYKAMNRYNTDDIAVIGLASNNAIRQYYMSWFALREVAPNSKIFVSENSRFASHYAYERRIMAMARAKEVHTVNVDEIDIINNVNPLNHVVAFGEDSASGRKGSMYPHFVIAMDYDNSVGFKKLGSDVTQISKSAPIKNGSSFVLIDWDGPEESLRSIDREEPFIYTLLIETALLPKDMQKELLI